MATSIQITYENVRLFGALACISASDLGASKNLFQNPIKPVHFIVFVLLNFALACISASDLRD